MIDFVVGVAHLFKDDCPASVRIEFEDTQPCEEELRRIGPEEFDSAIIRHREIVLLGDLEQLPTIISRPGQDGNIAYPRWSRVSVLILDCVVLVAFDLLYLCENCLVFILMLNRFDGGARKVTIARERHHLIEN